ncbi:hypothetical protein AB0C04_27865 [Micromonospora sp. NPDC048909]|uniref:hypothetical protein n=1 Tax=Micromonospora sp. NPDC048909 TaxID=3155643 RepID=UPI0033EE2327
MLGVSGRALSFGAVAEAYERFRPGYPVAMLAELRKHVPANVKTVHAAFEDLRTGGSYGLVYVAAALIWTSPEGRWPRMARSSLPPTSSFTSRV